MYKNLFIAVAATKRNCSFDIKVYLLTCWSAVETILTLMKLFFKSSKTLLEKKFGFQRKQRFDYLIYRMKFFETTNF